MATDIFGYTRNPKPAGVLSNENSTLVIGGASGANLATLVQNWSIQYQQNVEEIFELGSNRMFWKKGRPQGAGSIARMVGAGTGPGISMFSQDALDICNGGASMAFTVGGGGCTAQAPFTINLAGVVVTGDGFASQVQDAQVTESISWRFAQMAIA